MHLCKVLPHLSQFVALAMTVARTVCLVLGLLQLQVSPIKSPAADENEIVCK